MINSAIGVFDYILSKNKEVLKLSSSKNEIVFGESDKEYYFEISKEKKENSIQLSNFNNGYNVYRVIPREYKLGYVRLVDKNSKINCSKQLERNALIFGSIFGVSTMIILELIIDIFKGYIEVIPILIYFILSLIYLSFNYKRTKKVLKHIIFE